MDRISELFRLAAQNTESGNFARAVESYEKIIKLASNNDRAVHMAHWGIGDIYLVNGQYDQAKLHFRKALELAPNTADYHYLLGCTLRYTEEIDDSIVHLRRAVDLDPSRSIFWGELGWVVGHFRNPDKGIEYLKRAMSLNPTNAKALTDLTMLYASKEKWSEALLCVEEALKHDPSNDQIIEIQGKVRFFASEFERLTNREKL